MFSRCSLSMSVVRLKLQQPRGLPLVAARLLEAPHDQLALQL